MIPPTHTLSEEESRHAVRVLRLVTGDEIHITDGEGNLYHCHVTVADQRHCEVEVDSTETEYEKLPYRLIMAVAPTKNNDRFEWFLEKATEVGIDSIIPLESAHSERRVYKEERGEKVITSAMKQSLKAYHPHLRGITPFKKLMEEEFSGRKFIAHCADSRTEKGKVYLPDTLLKGEDALILIGPEGDFSDEEIDMAVAHGFEEITLGTQRLRTETAAVTAVVMTSVINTMK